MIIKTEISYKEYKRLLFHLTYKKPMMRVLIGVAFLLIVWIIGYDLHFLPVPRPEIYQYITLFLIVVVQPTIINRTISLNYKSSAQLGEKLEIDLSRERIKIQGESFYTETTCESLYKVDEQAKWFLIYQNNLSAIIIPKRVLTDAQQEEFRKILTEFPDTPVNLAGRK